jgi:hypothetical protein
MNRVPNRIGKTRTAALKFLWIRQKLRRHARKMRQGPHLGRQPLGKAGFKPKIHDISPLESAGFSQKRGKRATPGIAAMGCML